MSFADICAAVYYWGAFNASWGALGAHLDTERSRRRWLERHLIERARLARDNG